MTVIVSPSTVRIARPDDHQELWRMMLSAHTENGLFTLSPEKVEFLLQRSLNPQAIHPMDQGPRGTIGVIGTPKQLEAFCWVLIGQFWYSNDYHIEELIAYVDPEFRHSDHSKALIDWMKSLADEMKIPVLTGVMSNFRTEAKVRLYKRHLPPIGAFFLYPNANGANGRVHTNGAAHADAVA